MFRIKFLFIVVAIAVSCSCVHSDFTSEEIKYFGDLIQDEFMPSNNVPGVGFAVFKADDTFAEGYGFKNLENLLNANNQTNFAVASVTKSLTATLVVKTLSEKFPSLGTSALNEPIVNLLPKDYNFTLSDRYRSETVTFRDLLSHRACLSTNIMGRTFGAIRTSQEFAYRARYIKEICPFRTGYNYNNAMYGLMADLLGAVAGSTFSELARNLLDQIGMTDTLIISEDLDFGSMENMSRGYYRRDGTTLRFNSELLKRMAVALPSGGMLPTPGDMIKYINFHLNYGKVGNTQIVPANMMRQLHRPSFYLSFALEDTTDPEHIINGDYAYGLGLRLGLYDNWGVSSHEGTWPPFRSRLSLYPALKIGIFSVTNGPGTLYGLSHQDLHESIFNKLLGKTATNVTRMTKEEPKKIVSRKHHRVNTNYEGFTKLNHANLSELIGQYGNPIYGDLNVFLYNSGTQLYLQYGRWGTGVLENVSDDTFTVVWDSDIVGDFLSADNVLPVMTLTFVVSSTEQNVVIMNFSQEDNVFTKDFALDKYPPQIWTPDSCSPEYIH